MTDLAGWALVLVIVLALSVVGLVVLGILEGIRRARRTRQAGAEIERLIADGDLDDLDPSDPVQRKVLDRALYGRDRSEDERSTEKTFADRVSERPRYFVPESDQEPVESTADKPSWDSAVEID